MQDIRGEKYKLAGIGVVQKGALVKVFATFCGVNEDIHAILTEPEREAPTELPAGVEPGTVGALLHSLPPLPRRATLPNLSVDDIVEVVVGRESLQNSGRDRLHLTDTEGVIKDLGPEKLAQVLVEMGKAREQYLREEHYTFVPQTPAPNAP